MRGRGGGIISPWLIVPAFWARMCKQCDRDREMAMEREIESS